MKTQTSKLSLKYWEERKRKKVIQLQRKTNTDTKTQRECTLYPTIPSKKTVLSKPQESFVTEELAKEKESLWLLTLTDTTAENALTL